MKAAMVLFLTACVGVMTVHAHVVLQGGADSYCPDETYTLSLNVNGSDWTGPTDLLVTIPGDWWLVPDTGARSFAGLAEGEISPDGTTIRWRCEGGEPSDSSMLCQIPVRAGLEEGLRVISWMIVGAELTGGPMVESGLIPVNLGGPNCPSHESSTWRIESDGTGAFPTIQHAIDASGNGDVIELGDGVFRGPGNRNIVYRGRRITVRSRSGNPDVCVIDCQKEGYGFLFTGGESSASVLDGVTIANGRADRGAGAHCVGGSPTIRRCVFARNVATYGGGGIWCEFSQPVISECLFTNNGAPAAGGGAGMGCKDADPTIEQCEFRENVWNALYCDGGSPTISRCTFEANDTGALLRGGDVLFSNCTFAYNAGRGVASDGRAAPRFRNTIIAYTAMGPAFEPPEAPATFINSNLYANQQGDWIGGLEAHLGVNGNISMDPLFSGASNPDAPFTLSMDSPCLTGPEGESEPIGAWPSTGPTSSSMGPSASARRMCIDGTWSALGHCQFAIRFHFPETADGRPYSIEVVNRAGQTIRFLSRGNSRPGCRMVFWDGRDDHGDSVASGIYSCRIRCGKEEQTASLPLLW
jgi:hypothetical protein